MHIITRMQTRTGKTYATNSSSSRGKNNIILKMKVEKVDNVYNRMTLRSQTRTGKTNNSGNTYTATCSSSREKNNIKLEIKVEKVEKVVNRIREPRPTPTPTPRPISTNRIPSGFVIPTKISDELAKFLGKPVGTEMPRIDVSRHINNYIRVHKLQDQQNGRRINPDAKLRSILSIGENDELTYFNLQKYMKHHFIRDN